MALPTMTPEQRQAALEKAAEARAARTAMLNEVKAGKLSLAAVLGRDDDTAKKTRVSQLLRALPGVGKVSAEKAMADAGIEANRRVGGLGARQREALNVTFPQR
ncbi:integration host factor, actinobacterial type [Actinoallomurus iriomotensis]|uniref:30S ribosomal protein S13 n=1 Tax=Actinoallomurus iriomotensis TaxID=478107 RepID=A0A9W6RHI5_9ACTN|nr:integration host factor, actinobacterial type [Actinoallomurus iriomotensis]GLY76171.1 30S ribosomal protein S13 [Actinoallomurus iriomotensis]